MEDNTKRTKLHKSLQLCISRKLKKIPRIHIPSSNIPVNIASRRLLSTCRFPRTPSLDIDQAAAADNSREQAATLSDVDRFLFDNFRSLYIHDRDEDVCLSSSLGTSSSLANGTQPTAETSSLSESGAEDIREASPGDEHGNNTAIVLFSIDPYTDFRGSMQNMTKMHHCQESKTLDWDFLEELLFYYLQLNDQSVHKYILKAFADLTAGTHKDNPVHGKEYWVGKSKIELNHL
ncbi:transcription repressor OFP14 [Brachypodium distachyon]|uniref:transcription repressor OFP14 n=1 Tax=Brachypodium distachyon TaxID=15368 RepID=UPI00052FFD6F|nr:transcription repressor OFP14 [Brachypodium distachyon]|eukprot:XP_010233435.1 transcription repressor OFP14 [Brachypodium distachyon]